MAERMSPEQWVDDAYLQYSRTNELSPYRFFVQAVRDAESEAFAAGVEQGRREARRVVGAPLDEKKLELIRKRAGLRPKDADWGAHYQELIEHIDYLTSVIALMIHDSDAHHQGVLDGLAMAVEKVKESTDRDWPIGNNPDPDDLVRDIEQMIEKKKSV